MSDLPPLYHTASLPCPPNLPQYTQRAAEDERVLTSEPSSPVFFEFTHTRHCVFKSRHLEIDLGQFPATFAHPAYGFNGVVEGVVRFTKCCSYVTEVTVKLEGTVTTTSSEYATVAVPTVQKTTLVSHTATLVTNTTTASTGYRCMCPGREYAFALPFPSYIAGRTTPLPPSYMAVQPGVCVQVEYVLIVEVMRKGLFRRREVRRIPVLYLPKTRPSEQPLTEIPHAPLETFADRMTSLDLLRVWSPSSSKRWSASMEQVPTVQLLLPFPRGFASGDPIPVGLAISCPASPALAQMYTSCVSIALVKRTAVVTHSTRQRNVRDVVLAAARPLRRGDAQPGTESLWYVLEAGHPGREASWAIGGVMEVSYLIRVVLKPTQLCLPTFRKDEPVRLFTDAFDTLEIEALDGSLSAPAVGLIPSLPPHLLSDSQRLAA